MALMKCPECGKDVSERAGFCPHCGLDSPKLESFSLKENPLATILAILILIFMGWFFNRFFFS